MYIYGNTPLTYMTFYDFDSNLKKILQPTALHTFCRCCFLCLIAHFLLNFFQIAACQDGRRSNPLSESFSLLIRLFIGRFA